MKPVELTFRISAWTPATLPMKRLTEYMAELSRLFGEQDHVHFNRLRKGSVGVAVKVEYEAAPKVYERLRAAKLPPVDAPEDVVTPFRVLNKMLAEDNAVGKIVDAERGAVILDFPGKKGVKTVIGPVVEDGALVGVVVRVGGKDKSAHALIEDESGVQTCWMTRDLAKDLGRYLYQPVRIVGRGRWTRLPDGVWQLDNFHATSFDVLRDESLRETFAKLGGVADAWGEDGASELSKLRRDE
jgi:hypothetical protein